MTVSAIGVFALIFGVYGLYKGQAVGLAAFAASLLFGAAAGVIFDNLGGVNLMLAHIMLGFLALGVVLNRRSLAAGLDALAPGRPGFWLMLVVGYGAISAIFLPRLFLGATMVYAVSRGGDPTLGPVALPLAPVSGNVSQMFYILSDLVCFFACSAATSTRSGFTTLCVATLAAGALNIAFAMLDYATFAAGAGDALAFMRNATYRMLDDNEVLGYKRIVGSFSEASSFATATLGFFGFTARLALAGRYLKFTAPIALGSVAALLASTSTTGYVGLAVAVLALYLGAARSAFRGTRSVAGVAFLCAGPPLFAAVVAAAMLDSGLWAEVMKMVNETVLAKASSDSGEERGAWNTVALSAFRDTYFLGAGVGSVRAASFPVAVLASIGAPGALLFLPFFHHVFFKPLAKAEPDAYRNDVRAAARFACFVQLVAATLAGVFIDLGLQFFVFASLAATERFVAAPAVRRAPQAPAPRFAQPQFR